MEEVFKDAQWIQASEDCESPQFITTFDVTDSKTGHIAICGLGYFELYINGEKVGDDLLVPAWSQYESLKGRRMIYPIYDTLDTRTYYLTYDVTKYLQQGSNQLGIWLGNGWYNQREKKQEGDFDYGTPKLCFTLEWKDISGKPHTVYSNLQMKWKPSGIIFNNIYFGETQDFTRWDDNWATSRIKGAEWKAVTQATAPTGILQKQECPTDKEIRKIMPTIVYQQEGRTIYDCGENITGYAVVKTLARVGAAIEILYSEMYDEEQNKLDFVSAGGDKQIQKNKYICSDTARLASPKFTWQGFRFFEVRASEPVEVAYVQVVHGDVGVTSSFKSSDNTLNWIYESYLRTQLGNIHSGVLSDCPHRERLGYTGDGQITSEAAMLCLDSRELFTKWMTDVVDSQDKQTGHVQHTAPFYGGGGGPGGWGSAIFVVPWNYYQYFGDSLLLSKYFDNILLWLDYMESRTENHLVTHEEKDGWCLGDWCAPDLQLEPAFVNSYYYIKGMQTVLQAAEVINRKPPVHIKERLNVTIQAFIKAFYDEESHSFCSGVNGADAFGLDIGLGTETTVQNLVGHYTGRDSFDTGIFGTYLVIKQLFERGYANLAYEMLTCTGEFSYNRMQREGATTIWETWQGGEHSRNHPMFGSIVGFFFLHILGIKQKAGSVGFKNISIDPAKIDALDWAQGSIQTPAGEIWVEVKKDIKGNMVYSYTQKASGF